MMNTTPNLRTYEAHCKQIVVEERPKPCHGRLTYRTYRHRMANGMLQVLSQISHKRKARNENLS